MDCPVSRSHVCFKYKDIKYNDKSYELFKCDECGTYYIATPDCPDGKKFRGKDKKGKEILITNIHTNYIKSKLTIGGKVALSKEDYLSQLKDLPQIEKGSFIVIQDVFKCMFHNHSLKNVEVAIPVLNKKHEPQIVNITAGYCSHCDRYSIMRSAYEDLQKRKGEPLCDIYDEKEKKTSVDGRINRMELREESILHRYGYSVAADGLSDQSRKKILASLIDYEVISKNGIISYLDFFISSHAYDDKFQNAIFKWEEDKEFVLDYKTGEYTRVGVYAFYK